jgi:hypothetical protein
MDAKKANKNAYKQMKFRVGIFQIKNTKNNKLFLQTSGDLERAFNSDNFQLKMGLHSNRELQNDWNTLGSDNFEFSILDEMQPKETSTASEIKNDLKNLLELHRNELLENGELIY